MLKHVGKMKYNDAKVCVIYRTLPGDAYGALVVGTASLSDTYHNALMSVVESAQGQQANELGDILSTRYFPDGTNMLEQLHTTGKLLRVETDKVAMTPTTNEIISLDELNLLIAEQKGVTLDDLSIKADMPHMQNKTNVQNVEIKDLSKQDQDKITINENATVSPTVSAKSSISEPKSASDYRSQADKLYKEAARLRKIADEIDPPKKKIVSASKEKTT